MCYFWLLIRLTLPVGGFLCTYHYSVCGNVQQCNIAFSSLKIAIVKIVLKQGLKFTDLAFFCLSLRLFMIGDLSYDFFTFSWSVIFMLYT